MTYIFLDTNIFLHYQPIEQIKWLEVVGSDKVTIVIAPVVIRELDKIKDRHSRAAISDRARKILKKIESVQTEGSSLDFKEGIELLIEKEPSIDFTENGLFRDISDDHLIASILAFTKMNPDAHVVLIARDTGPRIKANQRGVELKKLPMQYILPDSSDETQKEIRQLKLQVEQLKNQFPDLILSFANGNDRYKVSLEAPLNLTDDVIAQRLAKLEDKYPKAHPPHILDSQPHNVPLSLSTNLTGLLHPDPGDFKRYNEKLVTFFKEYDNYLRNLVEEVNLRRRTIQIDIKLSNRGTAPAENIDVFMHFPDGILLYEKHKRPPMPKKPTPPQYPSSRTMLDMMKVGLHIARPSFPDIISEASSAINISNLDIRKTNSYEVIFDAGNLKQHMSVPSDPLSLVFDSFEAASSFGIEYRINAANLPEEINGTLNVVIEKDSMDED